MKYNDFMSEDNVAELREGIMAVLYVQKCTVKELAHNIGILPAILGKFIKEEGDVSLLTLMKIDEYVKSFMEKK